MLFRMAEHHAAQNHCSQIRSNSSCIKEEPVRSQSLVTFGRLTKDKQQRKSIGLRLTINTSISAKMHKCDTHLSEVTRSVHWRRLTVLHSHTRARSLARTHARTHARHADGMSASVMMWTAGLKPALLICSKSCSHLTEARVENQPHA